MRVVAGVGKFGAVRTTKGRPLQANTNSLSPWLPSLDSVTYFTSVVGDILDWMAGGDGTLPSHAVMEGLALD